MKRNLVIVYLMIVKMMKATKQNIFIEIIFYIYFQLYIELDINYKKYY